MENKIAVVTGGANGIGLAFCDSLLKNGLKKLHILDWNKAEAEKETDNFNKKYGSNRVAFHQVNVADLPQYKDVLKTIIKDTPNVDLWINNAGVTTEEQTVPVNLIGTIHGIQLAMEHMGKDKGGKGGVVVNVGSHAGFIGMSLMPSYCASKWGVIGLTKAYGKKRVYEQTGVKVMAICPGYTVTALSQNVDGVEKVLDEIRADGYRVEKQNPEHVANGLIKMLRENIHGSFWICENAEEAYRIEIAKYTDLKV